ncbi:MAG TPA: ATP-binding cassette domain-containing protein [Candidatus Limnocylindria bacterium]
MQASGRIVASLRDATIVLDDRPIVRGFELEIAPGITVLRGPNGSGKTTVLRALAGLLPLARGDRTAPAATLYIGHRPQLLRGLSARDNLRFFARFRGEPGDGVDAALGGWGLSRRDASRAVEALSAGQRRRASLARLETETCPLVLLDEPFGELDDDGRALLSGALERFVRADRAAVVATHAHPELDARSNAVVRLG